MAKSFCSGCKHWQRCDLGYFTDGGFFMYCDKINKYELNERKKQCDGKYYEKQG